MKILYDSVRQAGYLLLFIGYCAALSAEVSYEVTFSGVDDSHAMKTLQASSELVLQQNHPPKTLSGLRRRTDEDIPNLVKALHHHAFYGAHVDYLLLGNVSPAEVIFQIETGPVFTLGSVTVEGVPFAMPPKDLGLRLGQRALPRRLRAAEERIYEILENQGYPFAILTERKVVADLKEASVHVVFRVNVGPKMFFGPTTILGNTTVKSPFICRRIEWKEGEPYSEASVEATQETLEATGLFSQVGITQEDVAEGSQVLPMRIDLKEGNARSVGAGLGYSTQRGPGVTGSWEHRNLRGGGERYKVSANILAKERDLSLLYVFPDFGCLGREVHLGSHYEYEVTKGFTEASLAGFATIVRQWRPGLKTSTGAQLKVLRDTHTDNNGNFNIIQFPLSVAWSSVDEAFDPSRGFNLRLRLIPSFQCRDNPFTYCTHTTTFSLYRAYGSKRPFVIAMKWHFGTILGTARRTIPASERFYAGSEALLRGFRYFTVSPMGEDHVTPIGGRSILCGTFEARWHFDKNWGAVLFYDVGAVDETVLPNLRKGFDKSVGCGVRYYTPVAPIRFDIAFPLTRRKHVDRIFEIYFSVGQSF